MHDNAIMGSLALGGCAKHEPIVSSTERRRQTVTSRTVVTQEFQFIDLSVTSTEEKRRNRRMARSHAMKVVRGAQRRKHQSTRPISRPPISNSPSVPDEEDIETIWSKSASRSSKQPESPPTQDASSADFATTMARSFRSTVLPPTYRSMVEYDIPALQMYSGKGGPRICTPALHVFIDQWINGIWPLFSAQNPSTKLSPLATEWFNLIRTSPALFHASMWLAGAVVDARTSTEFNTQTPEMIAHKMEAIRQINLHLSKDVSDTVILAILSLTKMPKETKVGKQERLKLDSNSPFKRPPMPPPWVLCFTGIDQEDVHFNGAQAIVRLKGGISGIKSPCVAKVFSHFDLREAALNLRKPYYPFYKSPGEVEDASVNVLANTIDESRGKGLLPLLSLGMTEELFTAMCDMVNLTGVMEAFSQGTLLNPDFLALMNRRSEIYHRLLLMPTGPELEMSSAKDPQLYDCCRLAALTYATAALFIIPPSTGCPQRLVLQVQSAMKDVCFEVLYGNEAKFFIWILFLAGIGAEGMAERSWFIERLRGLLVLEGISRWSEIKNLVMNFVWMSSVCDEGAMNLWDDVAKGLGMPVRDWRDDVSLPLDSCD